MKNKNKVFGVLVFVLVAGFVELSSFVALKISGKYPKSFDEEYSKYIGINTVKKKQIDNNFDAEIEHPYFGHVMSEESRKRFNSPYLNKHGFVNPMEFPYKKQKDEIVIGFFGGSVSYHFSFYAQTNDKFVNELIEEIPELQKYKITVLNMAFGGSKQPQQFYIYSFFADMFDYVIQIDGENDVNLPPPVDRPIEYPYYSNILYRDGVYNKLQSKKLYLLKEIISDAASIYKSLIPSSFIYSTWLVVEKIYKNKEIALQKSYREESDRENFYENFSYEMQTNLLFESWERFSRLEVALLKHKKTPYAFFIQPTQYLPGSKILSEEEKQNAFDKIDAGKKKAKYLALENKIKNMRSEGINYFPLTRIFKDTAKTVFNDPCCHLNDLGNEIMGRKIIKKLKEINFFQNLQTDVNK
jgi:hypothetical protein